jgi:hypothetical protein
MDGVGIEPIEQGRPELHASAQVGVSPFEEPP